MKILGQLLKSDFKLVFRDTFVQFLALYPLILGLATRFLMPFLTDRVILIDLTLYYNLIGSTVIGLQVALIAGTAIGLLVLDEKDQRTLTALQVTPLSLRVYLAYRLGLPVIFSMLGSLLIIVLVSNFLPMPAPLPSLLVVFLGALPLPVYALFISAMGQNKVQGIALSKGLGPFIILPVLAWFVPEPWQWLFGIIPTFWPAKAYWQVMAGENLALVLWVGLGCCLLWNSALWVLFQRRVVHTVL